MKEVDEKKDSIKSEAPLNDYVPVPAMEISEPSLSTDKRALLIGINYIGTEYELHGCVDDMLDVQDWLISEQGYIASNITLMSDDPSVAGAIMPTCANILAQMSALVASAVAGSERFFAYSGHGGTAQVDANSVGSDAHGIAETICALDEDIINADIRATLDYQCQQVHLYSVYLIVVIQAQLLIYGTIVQLLQNQVFINHIILIMMMQMFLPFYSPTINIQLQQPKLQSYLDVKIGKHLQILPWMVKDKVHLQEIS